MPVTGELAMGIMGSLWRFVSTLGGLVGSSVDSATEGMLTTPAGIKATYAQARDEWTKQYKDVRDAVSQLMVVIEQKADEIDRLEAEHEALNVRMAGAIERFKATDESKYKEAYAKDHVRQKEIQERTEQLRQEREEVEKQVAGYKARLKEMQERIGDLDQQEARALADIVSSKQIVQLNDRLSNLSTTFKDKNLQAIDRQRNKLKAQAKLSSELSGNDDAILDRELKDAGTTVKADDAFEQALAASKSRDEQKAGGQGQQREI
jgi:phage shock protein A